MANSRYKSYGYTLENWDASRFVGCEIGYLLLCQRYIELNPVRAGMVDDPAQYRWSSYRANGLGQADELLTPHALYLSLDKDAQERQLVYRGLFRPAL